MHHISQLNDVHLPSFIDLAINVANDEERAARIESYRQKLATNDDAVKDIIVVADETGHVIAVARLSRLGESSFTLTGFPVAEGIVLCES